MNQNELKTMIAKCRNQSLSAPDKHREKVFVELLKIEISKVMIFKDDFREKITPLGSLLISDGKGNLFIKEKDWVTISKNILKLLGSSEPSSLTGSDSRGKK